MDLIKLDSKTTKQTELSSGEAINGWARATWVERYHEAGEFTIEAPLSSGLRTFLPLGSFVSHLNTRELMMVEDHQIKKPKDEDPTIVVTGRSFSAFLENRTVGDETAVGSNAYAEYVLSSNTTLQQAISLISDHLISSADSDNNLTGVTSIGTLPAGSPALTSEERNLPPNNVYSELIKLLKVDDLGVRTFRPSYTNSNSQISVFLGTDRSQDVRFSWLNGDLEGVEYLFSNRIKKNYARVIGRWVQVLVSDGSSPTEYDRRTMVIDASDIDQQQSVMPSGGALTLIVAAMTIRGREALASQKNVSIAQVDISANAKMKYREDYNMGDLVSVDGDFGSSEVMRVIEYAEIVDENGSSGHPTLEFPGGEE